MIAWIKEWSEGIVIAVIIATILEILLPDNNNKKYINTVIGVYILFSIISPIISKFTGQNINIEDYINKNTSIATNYTMSNIELLENDSNIEDIYIKILKEDITNKINKSGFNVDSIELKLDMNSESNYGEILGIYLHISSLDKNKNINNVNEVKIDLSENSNKKFNVSEGQINQVKEVLMDTYGIDKAKIYINEE